MEKEIVVPQDPLTYERQGHVLATGLDRPAQRTAFDDTMLDGLAVADGRLKIAARMAEGAAPLGVAALPRSARPVWDHGQEDAGRSLVPDLVDLLSTDDAAEVVRGAAHGHVHGAMTI
jgi:enoyl-CoA hydratase/carnithine racemase